MTEETKQETALTHEEMPQERALIKPAAGSIQTAGAGVELRTLDEIWQFAALAARSQIIPKGDTREDIFVKVEMGLELGIAPMQAIQNIAVINGRPSLWGDAVPGLVIASGKCEGGIQIRKLGARNPDGSFPDSYGYEVTTKRKGQEPYSYTFLVLDAKKAGLWGKSGPWTAFPDRMLINRARTFCLRDVYPDVLKGIQTTEEVRDIVEAEWVDATPKSGTDKLRDIVTSQKALTGGPVAEKLPVREVEHAPKPEDPAPRRTRRVAEPESETLPLS